MTENGTSLKGENDLPVEKLLEDEFRAEYFRTYINALAEAYTIDKVDVRGESDSCSCIWSYDRQQPQRQPQSSADRSAAQGYMAWSLME